MPTAWGGSQSSGETKTHAFVFTLATKDATTLGMGPPAWGGRRELWQAAEEHARVSGALLLLVQVLTTLK